MNDEVTDEHPPLDPEQRVRIGVPLLVSLLVSVGTAAATWGALTSRLAALEEQSNITQPRVQAHAEKLAAVDPKLDAILNRLERIERKLDRE